MDDQLKLTLPEAPGSPDFVFRRFGGKDDFPRIAAVMNASLTADGSRERVTAEDLINSYTHSAHWDPQRDVLLVELEDRLIGCASVESRAENGSNYLHCIDLYLAAAWRHCSLEWAIQNHLERLLHAKVAAEPDGAQHWFVSKVPETWPARVEALHRLGYAPLRCYFEMQRPLQDGNLPGIVLPAGLSFRPPVPEHYRPIWEANVECFRDQNDYVPLSEQDYQAWVESPGLDPGLWLVAWDGDQVAGAAINVIHEGTWGETDDLFVRRLWRRQGLGRALLVGSLHLFKERGLTTAGLGVEVGNTSGALDLYENLGYQPYQRSASYRKRMAVPPS